MVGGNNGGGLGLKEVPLGSRKMVMSLREIVNCPEAEIYATLKDCNMDPNEAVNRLLSQDTFREVKSKREKKKEIKDTTEVRTRVSGTSSRGGRSGTSRYGLGGSTQFSSSDPVLSYGKPVHKKENGLTCHPASLSSAPGSGNTYDRPPTESGSALAANKSSAVNIGDGILPVPQPSSVYQPAWVVPPGQMSMADIVKRGKPQNKTSSHHHGRRTSNTLPEVNPVVSTSWPVSVEDEWPSIEPTSAPALPPSSEPLSDSKLHDDASGLQYNTISGHEEDASGLQNNVISGHEEDDNMGAVNHNATENVIANRASVSDGNIQEDNTDGTSLFDNDMYQNRGSYQSHDIDHGEVQERGVSVSSMTAELQQFNIQDDGGSLPEDNAPSVVIPEHLLVQNADFSHLSFGSFKVGASHSAPLASIPVKTKVGEATSEADATAFGQSEARNSEYYGEEESYLDVSDSNLYHRAGASSVNYDLPSASQQEPHKPENPETEHEKRYAYPTTSQGYPFENTQQPNVASSQTHSGPQMQNNATLSSVMQQAYTNSLPSTLSAVSLSSGREIDLPYSPFPLSQTMPSKYANSASSLSGSAMSMPEALKPVGYSSAHPAQQSLSGTNVSPGPGIPQHLAMHQYPHNTLPLGPFTNMIGYPFMPPSYTYVPSAYQQAFAGNNYNHQSLAAQLLPHKMSAPVSSLPQSASVASGYGAFGSTTALPGNFAMNQQAAAAPSGTTTNYDDVLSSQYKDAHHLMMSLQQNENSAMWLQGPGSRTMSAVPANTYYGMQGQNQQAELRQAQQPSQNYGTLGYPNFYHTQAGISMDHQQQNPREGSVGGSQGQPKQSQQLWQNGY